MNRALFITIGIVVIIFAFVVWLYLFFNGSPINTNQVFSDLGIIEATERNMDPESSLDTNRGTTLNLADGTIQQITTEPVAGYGTASTSSGTILRYVERGTGYIQEVNLRSGLKKQVTPHSTPGAETAYFSPNLNGIVVTSNQNSVRKLTLIKLPQNQNADVTVAELPATAKNIKFIDEETIFYTRGSFTQTTGYYYNIESQEMTERFRLALPDATVAITQNGNYYVYPRPSAVLLGAAYKVSGNNLSPLGEPGLGLIPYVEDTIEIITKINETGTAYVSHTAQQGTVMPGVILPEKCAADTASNRFWCGVPEGAADEDYLENWYKGIVVSDDTIVEIDAFTGEALVLSVPKIDTGRLVDVTAMTYAPETGRLLFINKIDATLWSFDLY